MRPLKRQLSISNVAVTSFFVEKMKSYALAFVALTTIFFIVYATEICPGENCITPDKCEDLVHADVSCNEQGTSCCSVVKEEYRTHCRHWGGGCMTSCPSSLSHNAVDCDVGEVCCVLI